ncbi:MAG: hypothetical protein K6F54_11290 [Lachnospiraceae bacterium]|nr:hypothetical protein [Lachnospiraceae bacterium]
MKKRLSLTAVFICLILMNTMTVFAASDYDGGSGISIGLCIIIGLIVAGIACFIASSSMKSVHTATGAKQYEKPGTFALARKDDRYINTTQQRIHHQSSNPQGPAPRPGGQKSAHK